MNKQKYPKGNEAIQAVKVLAERFGIETTRWAVRKWDKGMSEKKKLSKLKSKLESELKRVEASLR